jgi:hypothetical protein
MTTGSDAALQNPLATPKLIAEGIREERRSVIREAESNTSQGQHFEIKCGSGMTLEGMKCHYIPLPRAGQG